CVSAFDLISAPFGVKMSQKPSLPQSLQTVQLVLTGNTRNLRLPSKFFYPAPQFRYLLRVHDIMGDIISASEKVVSRTGLLPTELSGLFLRFLCDISRRGRKRNRN
ncbi:hypothetical protein, partial [Candidatus Binatus soli]|uniref:hypothetical protein n=1 Tax=Candidatus Binatus soli TaxID=1953413 RepID=UPI003D14B905